MIFSHIGGYLPLKTMPYYVVGAVWCIATLVLVNAYNSTLISYVALPNQKPLINSIYDLRNRPDVNLVTNKNLNTEAVLLVGYNVIFSVIYFPTHHKLESAVSRNGTEQNVG